MYIYMYMYIYLYILKLCQAAANNIVREAALKDGNVPKTTTNALQALIAGYGKKNF
jgi:hypothetical protein